VGLHLQRAIENLKQRLLALSAEVEQNLYLAVFSLERQDPLLARKTIVQDDRIDQLEVELEEEGLKVLALHQPVASDLRFIVGVLRINSDLERIGDLAVNIAERAIFLSDRPRVELPLRLSVMAERAQRMLKEGLDALVSLDVAQARRVIEEDDVLDAMNREVFSFVYRRIREAPGEAEVLIHFLSATRYLERVGDHATNIAEDVIYLVDGVIVRHKPDDQPAAGSEPEEAPREGASGGARE
jgi:phosphate transport system protein